MNEIVDAIDSKLLAELSRDSSQSTKKLASKTGITRQTAASRIARLERNNVISGFRAKIDYGKLGYGVFFVLFLKLGMFEESMLAGALEEFRASHHVLMDASITGKWDIMQILAFHNTKEYDEYTSTLRTKYGKVFRDSKSHAILRIFKSQDDFIPEGSSP